MNSKKKKYRRNPLRLDPSQTALIRRAFSADMKRRFEDVRRNVWRLVSNGKAEGLTTNTPRFVFLTDDRKVAEFNKWLQEQVDIHILEVSRVTGEIKGQNPWLYKYIDSAYRKGQVRAYTAARPQLSKPQPFYDGSKAQFLESGFRVPERVSKLKLLYTRAFQNLKGVTATMGSQIGRQLADGVAHGKSGQEIARGMSKTIKGLTKRRARAIAHTEVINAHADGLLDAFEDLGVEEVNPDVEFTTSDDDGVCPICKALEGKIYTIKEARGVIPVHPNCLLPGTLVSASQVVCALRACYSGNVITIRTASGASITVTENHKLLTPFGFVQAKSLCEGDYTVNGAGMKTINSPNNNHIPAKVSEIFSSLSLASGVRTSCVSIAPEYLHGDALFCDGGIDVVSADGFLGDCDNPTLGEHSEELPLCSVWGRSLLNSLGDFDSMLVALSLASHGIMSFSGQGKPLFAGARRHTCVHALATVAGGETDRKHSGFQSCSADANSIGRLLKRFSEFVTTDQIVGINKAVYEGHVYDLQTKSGLYIGNNLLSSNCRCSWSPVIDIPKSRPKRQAA